MRCCPIDTRIDEETFDLQEIVRRNSTVPSGGRQYLTVPREDFSQWASREKSCSVGRRWMYTFNRPKAKRKSRVETLHASCIVHRIHRRWNLDTLPHLQSVGPERGRGGAALRMVSRRGHRIELGSRPGSGGLESGVDLLSDGCLDADPSPKHRWRYDIPAAAGAVFEISAGRIFDRTRLELSFAQQKASTRCSAASPIRWDAPGGKAPRFRQWSGFDDSLLVLFRSAYYDFPDAFSGISPYRAIGLGPRLSRSPGCTSPPITRTHRPMLQPMILLCRSTTAARMPLDTVLAGHLRCPTA